MSMGGNNGRMRRTHTRPARLDQMKQSPFPFETCSLSRSLIFALPKVMKTCEALRAEGFHSVSTIEFRLRTINYAEVQLEVPDFGSRHTPLSARAPSSAPLVSESRSGVISTSLSLVVESVAVGREVDPGEVAAAVENRTGDNGRDGSKHISAVSEAVPESLPEDTASTISCTAGVGAAGGVDGVKELSQRDLSDNGVSAVVVDVCHGVDSTTTAVASEREGLEKGGLDDSTAVSSAKKRPREEDAEGAPVANGALGIGHVGRGRNERLQPKAVKRAAEVAAAERGVVRQPPSKVLCAQPYPIMRGHTAFLTFATTPVARRPAAAAEAAAQSASSAGGTSSVVDPISAAAKVAVAAAAVQESEEA